MVTEAILLHRAPHRRRQVDRNYRDRQDPAPQQLHLSKLGDAD
jgi:hypothetical protein